MIRRGSILRVLGNAPFRHGLGLLRCAASTIAPRRASAWWRQLRLPGSPLVLVLPALAVFSIVHMAAAQGIYTEAYTFTTVAGRAPSGSADGAGSYAQFYTPEGVAVDGAGNVYVADWGNSTIRKITPAGGVSTIAGFAGSPGADDGTNSGARFYQPSGVAVGPGTNIYVADSGNNLIRKITPVGSNWVVTTLAGQAGTNGFRDGTGTNALFSTPKGVAVDSAGNVYVADFDYCIIRVITPAGVVNTIAGYPSPLGGTNDGTNSFALFDDPSGVAVDSAGNLYVADQGNDTIRMITPVGTNWVVTTIAGTAETLGTDDGTNALFDAPTAVAVDTNGNIYVADFNNDTIRMITPTNTPGGTNWTVSTMAGEADNPGLTDATGTNAQFSGPEGVAVDAIGNVYVGDSANNIIRKITSAAVVSTIAGSGSVSQGRTDGTGSEAQFYNPEGAAVDNAGNVYVADTVNNVIRKITSLAVVSTIAGEAGVSGTNDGAGSEAEFSGPTGVAADGAGNVYVADFGNNTIRKITPAGLVSTLAGLAGTSGTNDGTNSFALFQNPMGVAVDGATNLYVADFGNNTIRMIMPAGTNWVVTTIAGDTALTNIEGQILAGTNDGPGTNAQFNGPTGIALDNATNLYVTDRTSGLIRMITPAGMVRTIAGQAYSDSYADGESTNAQFTYPWGVGVDTASNVYVADAGNSVIRRITPAGEVSTIGGLVTNEGAANGAGSAASFNYPDGLAVDSAGNVYVADTFNNTIRKGVFTQYTPNNPVPYVQPPATGQIIVTLEPPEANGQWRFAWEQVWRNSGTAAGNLVPGTNYIVEFKNVPGYLILPVSVTETIPTEGGLISVTNHYYPTVTPGGTPGGNATLTVYLAPMPPVGVRSPFGWQFYGNTNWLPSGYATNLASGNYIIWFEAVSNYSTPYATPSPISLQIIAGQPVSLPVTYTESQPIPGSFTSFPMPVAVTNLTDLTDYPFGYNGQLITDVGYGSGVAVQSHVVLTAAHLVFNDQTLSYVGEAYWFWDQETNVFEPKPLQARSWYVLSGYAAQRSNDVLNPNLGAGQSSPQSRNLDVAALYFLDEVANGGYGGYLPSDVVPNPWLTGTAEKMLVGYPVDGSQFLGFPAIVAGQMYATAPQPYPLSLATDASVSDQQVYTAAWFLSGPGNSGGPLYVELNGYFYPAGVYLGTLYDGNVPTASLVRAIDSNVTNLIAIASTNGSSGVNNSGGGVITLDASQSIDPLNPALVVIQIAPQAAFLAGGAWKLASQPDDYYSVAPLSCQWLTSNNEVQVQFKPIPGWNLPTNQLNPVAPGTNIITASYTAIGGNITLTVITNGDGTVSPILDGKALTAGRSYALTATAKAGNVFSNWTGSITTNKNPLTVKVESTMVLQANFIPNPFLPAKGTYNGLFAPTNGVTEETAGMLKGLAVRQNGTYSGTLLINGGSHAISGSFNLAGWATNQIKRGQGQGGLLTVVMNLLNSSNAAPQVTGTVSGTNWAANLTAGLAANSLPSAEYTMLIPPDTNNMPPTNSPGGDGYALITNHLGTAKITGALADGTAFNQTVPVAQDGCVPIFANLYGSKGLLLGWINLDLTNTAGVSLTWIRPARAAGLYTNGFSNVLLTNQILLSRWSNSPASIGLLTNLSLLDTINDTNALTNIAINVSDTGAVAGRSVSGAINSKTGLVTVTIGSGASEVTGYGAILLNETNGGGYFLTSTNAEAITLGP